MQYKPYLFIFFLLFISCKRAENSNKYFYNITKELSPFQYDTSYINKAKAREFEKYKKTGEKKYLISSKYIEFLLLREETSPAKYFDQIPLALDLLKLNNDKYSFISMSCYFHLSLKLEKSSPDLAMKFLDSAIMYNKKEPKEYFIAHLYHAKGRFYYNKKDYSKALLFFNQSLNKLAENEYLFRASMYNNFSSVYRKTGNYKKAIEEVKKGINILIDKGSLTRDEKNFLFFMKQHLAVYLLKIKNYGESEQELTEALNHYNLTNNYHELTHCYNTLFELYTNSGQNLKNKDIILHLKEFEHQLKSTEDLLTVNKIFKNYYIQNNDLPNLIRISQKVNVLYDKFNVEQVENIKNISSISDNILVSKLSENHQSEIDANKKISLLTYALLITVSIILISITLCIIKRHREKITETEGEKKLLANRLSSDRKKINQLYQNINLKKDTEKIILENLKKIKNSSDTESSNTIKEMISTINNLGNIDKKKFVENNYENSVENQLFTEKLLAISKLTKTELKLCNYFKMDLSAKEIATIENTSPGTIRVYKTKIKNKLNVPKNQDLNSFLALL
ncbi:hypothetical protein F3J23_17625 [Chryseobacterium sp. Tr-659]|uniref:LuxR C-terminal-related transcriptional regulator n=1 Tax=Chryseobacterium sp. Tr-659 TaxID=2608340 RepID=UPI00141FE226|nr:LuxR C-terminal-related transcriptional regulator [Chryseobacterium sp. Tr-659]NIF07244.1 hypothetical protein [Chryseobacterium sp. Tr-659]